MPHTNLKLLADSVLGAETTELLTSNYLIPQWVLGQGQDQPVLDTLVAHLVAERTLADASARELLGGPNSNLTRVEAYANQFTTTSTLGVTRCMLKNLEQMSHFIEATCQNHLLPLGQALDARGEAPLIQSHHQDLQAFRLGIVSLGRACCETTPHANNLLLEIQTLIPALARLSSQIDSDALQQQANIADIMQTDVLPHLAQLTHMTVFNLQVNRVLITAQKILNVMSDWQDRLDWIFETSPADMPARFYENQTKIAILYWHNMQETLAQHLSRL
jgi:hypothetical protein